MPPSPVQPAVSPPGATMSAPPAKKSALPWVIGGCGCLTLLAIVVAVVCYFFYSKAKTAVEKASTMVEQAAKPTPSLQARTVSFPEKNPAFSFTLPAGYTTETGKDGGLTFTASDGFKFAIATAPAVKNEKDAKALVPTLLKAMADSMKGENFEVRKEVHTSPPEEKVWSTFSEASCKLNGNKISIVAFVFSLTPGKFYSLCATASEEVQNAHSKDFRDIAHSIGIF